MRSAASGIWNHSFSPAVNELAPFGAVCASAADTSVAATIRAALRATIDFLNIVGDSCLGLTPCWCAIACCWNGRAAYISQTYRKSRAQEIAESKESSVAQGL